MNLFCTTMSFLRLACVHSHGLNSLPEEYCIFSFTPPEKALECFKVLRIVKDFLKTSDDQTIKIVLVAIMVAIYNVNNHAVEVCQ